MALVFKKCVQDGVIADYFCDPCLTGSLGRVRGVAFIDKSLLSAFETETGTGAKIKNIENPTWWTTQILAGLITIIPTTRGTYDGGTSNMITGFGDIDEIKSSKTHTVVYVDSNHAQNGDFYQMIEDNATNKILAFRTDSELRVANSTIKTVEAKDAVEDDVNSFVNWEVTVTWDQKGTRKNVPIHTLTSELKALFDCIDISASTAGSETISTGT